MRHFITSLPGAISLIGTLILILWRVLATALPSGPLAPISPSLVLATQVTITMLVLLSSLYVVLSQEYEPETEKWAFGTIGLLIGYWLPLAR